MNKNNRVRINDEYRAKNCQWWPAGEVRGTIQKIFKNGQIAVAVDQLFMAGGDEKRTLHFSAAELEII